MQVEYWKKICGNGEELIGKLYYDNESSFVDLNCALWNRSYKSKKCAENYLIKNDYRKGGVYE